MLRFSSLPRLLLAFLFCVVMLMPVLAQDHSILVDRMEQSRRAVDDLDVALNRGGLDDDKLNALKTAMDPLKGDIEGQLAELDKLAQAVQARLKELGVKPEGTGVESPELIKERDETAKQAGQLESAVKRGRALIVQLSQMDASVVEKRRVLFAQAVFRSTHSFLSPVLWKQAATKLAGDIESFLQEIGSNFEQITRVFSNKEGRLDLGASLLLPVLMVLVAFFGQKRVVDLLFERLRARETLSRALKPVFMGVPAAWIMAYFLLPAFGRAGVLTSKVEMLLASFLLAGIIWYGLRLLANLIRQWHESRQLVVAMEEHLAQQLPVIAHHLGLSAALLIVVPAFLHTATSTLMVSVAAEGLVALLVALHVFAVAKAFVVLPQDDACLGPKTTHPTRWQSWVKLMLWLGAVVTVISLAAGYIAFSVFLAKQIVWSLCVGGFLVLSISVMDVVSAQSFQAKPLRHVSVAESTLKQTSLLFAALSRVMLVLFGLLLISAPWGVRTDDVTSWLSGWVQGFQVGSVKISPVAIAVSVGLFVLVMTLTRVVQRWLDKTYLPVTSIEVGLRSSIVTMLGYVGMAIAFALSFSAAGLSLENLAIVAGALSVGIGFGLQSIVNNFVSGLILLWERPIKVGDWIVVGGDQGYVRRINVRSTEIETFEKATVMIPNANLISGVVKNWMHHDKSARIGMEIDIAHGNSPEQVRDVLVEMAKSHKDILKEPLPLVLFKSISEKGMLFDLRFTVKDADTGGRVKSDLLFKLLPTLESAGITLPISEPIKITESQS